MKLWLLLLALPLFAETRTHFFSADEQGRSEVLWEELSCSPFKELTLSWNASRPSAGRYSFFISVRQNGEWSPWLYYAEWGSQGQIMFKDIPEHSCAFAQGGQVKPKVGFCDGYRVKVEGSGGADLGRFYHLSVCTLDHFRASQRQEPLAFVLLEGVPRFSQLMTRHPRHYDLALPTAMAALVGYCVGEKVVSPVEFAEKVIDDDTAFYENVSFNIAQASHYLNGAYLELSHLPDFAALHAYLIKGYPQIAFISGYFPGCPRSYQTEHAVCVIGYDPNENRVHCIDSGFPIDQNTLTSYSLPDFLRGWAKQRNKAIILRPLRNP
ncbi:MAG TPA: C39 family peptidase [Chlamydiales bacterium]|nr:C39 family peptidase [Chlamydiales bacterium]